EQVFTAEDVDNGGILVVFLTHEEGKVEVWRYNVIDENLEREQITSLDNRTLFVKKEASFLKPCVAPGLGNKIFFSMFHDNSKGIFYCLATRKYYSLVQLSQVQVVTNWTDRHTASGLIPPHMIEVKNDFPICFGIFH
ncbi:hypothetical protein A4A49_16886, partial [Nicotiana attenuata]